VDPRSLIGERSKLVDASGIRKVFDLAQDLSSPINLSIGQPHFPVAEPVKAKAMEAIESDRNKYTVTQGIPQLRREILEREKDITGVRHDSVMVTSGVSGGILLALMAMINEGDKVIVPDPYFVMYEQLTRLVGGETVFVDTYPDFRIRAEDLDFPDARDAKILLLNSPNNPTGRVMPEDELREVADWAEQNDVFILSDEIYRTFDYDDTFASITSMTDQALLLNGFSKCAAMTGWRVGYAIGPEPIIDEMTKLQQFSFVCAPSPAQYAAREALQLDYSSKVKAYEAKRDMVYRGLKDKFDVARPEGAFYVFVRAPEGDGDEFVKKAIERDMLIIPGSVFSEKNTHFRISFAAEDEMIQQGIEALRSMA
jgi:aspartate aminotransferase/aminotransferase